MSGWKEGEFCWTEIAVKNVPASKKFYEKIFDWKWDEFPMGEGAVYNMWKAGGKQCGGLYELNPEQKKNNVPPHWLNFVMVKSADEFAKRAKKNGGTIHAAPFDVMGKGRMAVLQGPSKETFALWEPKENTKDIPPQYTPGKVGWRELLTTDLDRSKAFYSETFNWKQTEHDMGGMKYVEMKIDDEPVCGIMSMPKEAGPAPSHWATYVNSENVDEATKLVKAEGGKVFVEPKDIPEIGRFATLADPQGAMFSIISFTKK